uniref:Uncharacterized protein n=1 Tax=Utricularia reniformis TaxID=192314 RepID=A0A1Y0AZV5_9LAMI|nr:hypothetical protein AEK19_MT0456 [Utricularia reniformis]ART30716.1 hypothetical protein AEK19_MT0456 [Utricularia reniformis]
MKRIISALPAARRAVEVVDSVQSAKRCASAPDLVVGVFLFPSAYQLFFFYWPEAST